MPRLTKRLVDHLVPPPTGDRTIWDTEVKGFGCRIWASGHKAFVIFYRFQGRRTRLTLGPYGTLTVEEARQDARHLLAQVMSGTDPAQRRRDVRDSLTVAELAQRYLDDYAVHHKKPSSVRGDRYLLTRHILPALGTHKVALLSGADLRRLHQRLRGTPGAANRVLALCSKLMTLAEQWHYRPRQTNPAIEVTRYPEHARRRYLTDLELARLGRVLDEAESLVLTPPPVVVCIRLLLLTGCRLGEVLGLRWEHLDLTGGTARLPDTKTGPRLLYLVPRIITYVQGLPRHGPWVIPGKDPRKHLSPPDRAWFKLRAKAGIPDVHLHDLRHTYASLGVQSGLSLALIGAVLGHRHPGTTAIYAHLAPQAEREAAHRMSEAVAQRLAAW